MKKARVIYNPTSGKELLKKDYEIVDAPPPVGKDVNDFLCSKLHIRQPNHNRERSVER